MNFHRENLLAAANILINHPDAQHLYETMVAVADLSRQFPIQLTGPAEPLNPLLEVRLDAVDVYERIIALVEEKRRAVGYEPLQRQADDKFDKNEYMREFMERKRQRQRRATDIENMMRPERDRLRGRARLDFMDRQSARWKDELDARLERVRQAHNGRIPKAVLQLTREQFWQNVDRQLDELEYEWTTVI